MDIPSSLDTAKYRHLVLDGLNNITAGTSGPLPAGTNVIGGVTLAKAATATRSDFTANTDTSIAAASTTRPTLSVYNNGPAILYIGQGSTAVTTSNFSYLLNPSDTYIANPNEVGLEHRGIFAASGSTAEVTIGA